MDAYQIQTAYRSRPVPARHRPIKRPAGLCGTSTLRCSLHDRLQEIDASVNADCKRCIDPVGANPLNACRNAISLKKQKSRNVIY